MKNLIIIIVAIFLLVPMTTLSAQKKKDRRAKKELAKSSRNKKVKNLDYTVSLGFEKGSELNFQAEYFVPFEGTEYEAGIYKTKDGEFFFRDEAIHVIDPVKNEVKEVTSDSPYVLVQLKDNETKN